MNVIYIKLNFKFDYSIQKNDIINYLINISHKLKRDIKT